MLSLKVLAAISALSCFAMSEADLSKELAPPQTIAAAPGPIPTSSPPWPWPWAIECPVPRGEESQTSRWMGSQGEWVLKDESKVSLRISQAAAVRGYPMLAVHIRRTFKNGRVHEGVRRISVRRTFAQVQMVPDGKDMIPYVVRITLAFKDKDEVCDGDRTVMVMSVPNSSQAGDMINFPLTRDGGTLNGRAMFWSN